MTEDRDRILPALINEAGHTRGVEVGVREGFFSWHLLNTTRMHLVGVDCEPYTSAYQLEKDFPGRYQMVKARSPVISTVYPDLHFGFVYIDADHSYAAVKADLEAWWPKVAPGGLFCGDDYADVDNPTEGVYGVVAAVNEFADLHGLELEVLGAGTDRAAQLRYAAEQGRFASLYLRGQYGGPRQNPCWLIRKPGGP